MKNKIKILIVDDHESFRKALRSFLSTIHEVTVIGEGGCGGEAVSLNQRLRPQLIIMDISMPGIDGIEASKSIKREYKDTRIILYSMYDLESYRITGESSADIFLPKDRLYEELPEVIKRLAGANEA